jgi:hypothetical protein
LKGETLRKMKRVTLALSCLAAVAATAAWAASSPVVRVDGRIGPFRIDQTTEAQLRALAGKPNRVENVFSPLRKAPVGRTLYYRCGRACQTAYSFNNSTGKLSDFQSGSVHFVSEHGSRVGMRAAEAARREGRRLVPGCGDGLYLHLRWDIHHIFVLTVRHGRVDGFAYLGRHSVFYEGLC